MYMYGADDFRSSNSNSANTNWEPFHQILSLAKITHLCVYYMFMITYICDSVTFTALANVLYSGKTSVHEFHSLRAIYESFFHEFGHVPPKIELAFSEKFFPRNYHFLLIRESFLPQMFPAIRYL